MTTIPDIPPDFATKIISENHHPDSPLGFIADCLQDGRLEVRTDVPHVNFIRTAHVFRAYAIQYAATHEPTDPDQRFPAVSIFGKRAFTQEAQTRFPVVHSNGHRFLGLCPGPQWVTPPPAKPTPHLDMIIPPPARVAASPAAQAFRRAGMTVPPHLEKGRPAPRESIPPPAPPYEEPPVESPNTIDWSVISAAPDSIPISEPPPEPDSPELTPPPDSGIIEDDTETPASNHAHDSQSGHEPEE